MIEPYDLNQEDTDITQVDTTAAKFTDLMLYRAPKGRKLILRPGDPLSCYLEDTGTTECLATDRLKLVKRDQTGEDEKSITGEILYASVKEFKDEDKLFRLPVNQEVEIGEQEYLALMVYSAVGCDKDTSYFDLVTRSKR